MEFSCFKGRNDRKLILLSPDEDIDRLPFPGTEVPLRKPWRNETPNLCFLSICFDVIAFLPALLYLSSPSGQAASGCWVLDVRNCLGALCLENTHIHSTITEVKSQKVTCILKNMNLFFLGQQKAVN